MQIVFEAIPIPPSSNNQYKSFMRNGRVIHVKAPELVQYKLAFAAWAKANAPAIKAAGEILAHHRLSVSAFFFLKHHRIFTKTGSVKRLDVSNRLKALHDCIAEAIGIDDAQFFEIAARKVAISNDREESVTVSMGIAD